ncbi:MAG TPA: glycosyltransferase family 92 protein [Anaerolineaceae bacterium]|nr:glycosyltransferase family 92 protein [Anaerolineaceae bacterium]
MDYLSLCLMFKDENLYLEEWILYHLLLGVERFYIYDNGSQIHPGITLAPYVDDGTVVVIDIAGRGAQLSAYDHFLRTFSRRTLWAGFIDTDEFLVPKTGDDLKVFLQDYEKNAGLAVNWVIFGSNGHKTRPQYGQLLSYTLRTPDQMPENQTIKSVIQPDKVLIPHSPHHFIFKDGYACVNEKGYSVYDQYMPFTAEKIQLNHYWCRSEEEINQKYSRGRGDGGDPYKLNLYEYYNSQAVIEDRKVLHILKTMLDPQNTPASAMDPRKADDLTNWIELAREKYAMRLQAYPLAPRPVENLTADNRDEIANFHRMAGEVCNAEKEKDLPNLIKDFLKLTEMYPTAIQFYCGLADALMETKDFRNSWGVLAEAWKRAPNNYKVLTFMGKFFHTIGQFERSEKMYLLAESQDPYGFRLLCWFARMYLDWGKYDRAFECIWKAVSSYPNSTNTQDILEVIKKLGVCYYPGRDADKVIQLFEIALSNNPEDVDLLINLGKIYFDQGYYVLAQEYLENAVQIDPAEEDALEGLRLVRRMRQQSQPAPV